MERNGKRLDRILKQAAEAPAGEAIISACLDLAEVLIDKNTRYGNSALTPIRIFSSADTVEQIKVRLDDKLSRLQSGVIDNASVDDAIKDLAGYLILLQIAAKQ